MAKLFLDSGAFSALSQGKKINVQDYISFIKEHEDVIDIYANLDVIGNAEVTLENQQIMEEAGLNPLPVFHAREEEEYLQKYIKKYPYICLGGMVGSSNTQLKLWLDRIFPLTCNEKGIPIVKVHGFGLTTLKLIFRYPWYSVDSSSWQLRGGGYGLIDVPINPKVLVKKENYYIRSIPIGKGIKGYGKDSEVNSFFSIDKISQCDATFLKNPNYKKNLEIFLDQYGFTLKELQNNHRLRAVWNAIYLMTSTSKFTNIIIYLVANDIKALRMLRRKMRQAQIDLDKLNILISFATLGKSSKRLDTMTRLKH